jgi:hypothetical protein
LDQKVNFLDHNKLLLSNDGHVVTVISTDKKVSTMTLASVFNQGDSKNIERLLYAKDILEKMLNKSKESSNGG